MATQSTERDELAVVLGRIASILQQPIDFSGADTEMARPKARLLAAAATYFNTAAAIDYGGRGGPVRGEKLVDQVVGVFQHFYGLDPHPEPFEKAAMLLRGILGDRPFKDGNERTGFLVASYYLQLSGYDLPSPLPVDQLEDLCCRVSRGDLRELSAIAAELRLLWKQ
jgi:prophage maintenance system killer protein